MALPIIGLEEIIPLLVFAGFVLGVQAVLSLISRRNSQLQKRLDRTTQLGPLMRKRQAPKVEHKERFRAVVQRFKALAASRVPHSAAERDQLKTWLANAGFRSASAVNTYLRLRAASLLGFLVLSLAAFVPLCGFGFATLLWVGGLAGAGFCLPGVILEYARRRRRRAIASQLPDVLDLLVVCLESGLGLDAAVRKVCDEMKRYAPVLHEELTVANIHLQIGRSRREVLHDLGERTDVDDLRSLAALLIQADRLGSSIAQALRVLSDSLRTRRRQQAEERAARTAVKMIFPLVLFVFPGMFVVLAGPAVLSNGSWPITGEW